MKIELDLSSEQAEMLVFACAMRARQKGLGSAQRLEVEALGHKIACVAGKAFGWHAPEKMLKHMLYPLKSVVIRVYETNPNQKP